MTGPLARAAAAALAAALAAASAASAVAAGPAGPVEPPALAARVGSGALPPVAARLPAEPRVVEVSPAGRHGGEMRMVFGRSKDTRLLVVYGYARLVAYDSRFRIGPDILSGVDVAGGRVFTLRLREGHRWSDGHPFTAEDFRYWWEDVANNSELSPLGPPRVMRVDGRPPAFEVLDERTVRYSWPAPNPYFLPALAAATPLYIYRPAHYLKRFHRRYARPGRLARMVKRSGRRSWAALHNRRDNQYKNDNPRLPTLQPWVLRTRPPAQLFLFDRNPYFHRVDQDGRQLPYVDRVAMKVAAGGVIALKTGAGESDLQARGIAFSDYTFLKEAEGREGLEVRLWRTAKGAHVALFPNLNARDPVWRRLMRSADFRRALSLAIDRHEINQVIYYGLAIEGQNAPLPASPLHDPANTRAWAGFDLARANALLDGLGLARRGPRGLRLLEDGRPMEIVVETAGEDSEQADVLELVHDSWLRAGIKLHTRPSQREVFRNRVFAGDTLVSVWFGLENGVPNPDTIPDELAPTSQQQLQWPKWGQYHQTGGRAGERPDDPQALALLDLARRWTGAPSPAARARIWRRMLAIHADQVFTIGLVAGVPQPVVVDRRLRNVPERAIFNWNPGAQFGVYMPDTFWFDDPGRRRAPR